MSPCGHDPSLLLEAEPEALAGVGPSEAAEQVRSCPTCAGRAQAIRDGTALLDRFLAGAPGPDIDAILDAAAPTGRPTHTLRPKVGWGGWAGLAAAAAVATVLLTRGDAPSPPSPTPSPPAPPLVESAPDQNVAVMATSNPDITVLWFYGEE